MRKWVNFCGGLLVIGLVGGAAQAQTATEAKAALKAIADHVKSKGAAKAAEDLTAGTDPSKCKEIANMNCFIAKEEGGMLGNAKNPKSVGANFPREMTDVDGVPVVEQVIGPLGKGKTSWEARYKFALPGTKKIVPQHAFCEKVESKTVACVVLQNAQ